MRFIEKHFAALKNSLKHRLTHYLPRRYSLIGIFGEYLACLYLRKNGYRVWDKNWKIRSGELDIVACKNRQLIFVEVKTRSKNRSGSFSACEAVNYCKQQRIKKLSAAYLNLNQIKIKNQRIKTIRYDVIGIVRYKRYRWRVKHRKNAFD